MLSPGPRTTLLALVGLAAVVLAGGIRLAREEVSTRIDRDREPLQRFSVAMQRELQRLETLYEGHLQRIAHVAKPEDAFEVRRVADRIIGIRQYSLLHREAKATPDLHVQISIIPGERTPAPTFEPARQNGPLLSLVLPKERLFNSEEITSGWIDQPGTPPMYWERISSDEVVVLMIDSAAWESAVNRWMKSWGAPEFEPVRAAGGPDQLRTRSGTALLTEGRADSDRPDLLLPVRSRLGAWNLASWDRREVSVRYNQALLTTSGIVAGLVAGLALLIFSQQRRSAALAAQRVSFVNRVSHELRSPLTNILLNIDLATEAVEDAPAEATRRLSLVQEEARRLGRLIDNVLTFSRHEQGKLRAEQHACVPAGVIASVVEQFAPSLERRALTVQRSGDLGSACLLDADALAQILANLLSNVEKYVPGGVVEITGSVTHGWLQIIVSDQGPGIPLEAAERIFRPFERLDSRVNEGSSGTGLGLAIARDLAIAMGGSLRLIPSARGASFELRVPAPPATPISAVSAVSAA